MSETSFSDISHNLILSPMAKTAMELGAVAGALSGIDRTVVYNVQGQPENVAEHSNMLAIVAPVLAAEFYPNLNADRVARLASIHDIVEAYVGDTPTHMITADELAAKKEREQTGLALLRIDYDAHPAFVAMVDEYEAQDTAEARFVRMMDKLMPLLAHFNDKKAGLRKHTDIQTPKQIRLNANERLRDFLKTYPEYADLLMARFELAYQLANELEAES